ncbi:hypothetical protein QN397_26140 [Variovorax sp. RTB1]|uniref:hypothetical protein n=1 Tax=Variovorax sp. RTB1 TaxID=3048631 RepID=UPI002B23EE43|nr:hypothetical protein [Variovorax sp. RTB1]MEB0114760.1 hypothetical protein [Variovorax sp. RTB1]
MRLNSWLIALCLSGMTGGALAATVSDGRYAGSMRCEPTAENRNRTAWQAPVRLTVEGNSITWTRDEGNTRESIKTSASGNSLQFSGYGGTRNVNIGTLQLDWKTDASLAIGTAAIAGTATISSKDGNLVYSRCQVDFPLVAGTASVVPALPLVPPMPGSYDGAWAGTLTCGRIAIQSSSPEGFTGSLNLEVTNGQVIGRRESATVLEIFSGAIDNSGRINLHGSGQRLDDPTKTWAYQAEGQVNAKEISVDGRMDPAAANAIPNQSKKLRDCRFVLTNTTMAQADVAANLRRIDDERKAAAGRLQAEREQAVKRDNAERLVEDLPAAAKQAASELADNRASARPLPAVKPLGRVPPARLQEATPASAQSEQSRALDKALAGGLPARSPPSPQQPADKSKSAVDQSAAEQTQQKLTAEKIAADEQATKLAIARAAADKAATDRVIAETAASKAAADRLAAQKAAAEKLKKQPVRAQSSMDL